MQNEGNGPWKQRPWLYYWWESNGKCTGEAKWGEALVLALWFIKTCSKGSVEFPGHPSSVCPPPSCWRGRCQLWVLLWGKCKPTPASVCRQNWWNTSAVWVLLCQVSHTSFKLSLCSDGAVCDSTVTSAMCATVAGEGWLPGKMWELCTPGLLQRLVFSMAETHLTLQYNKLRTCTRPVTASARRHFSARCGSIFGPL